MTSEGGQEVVYFTGTSPDTQFPGVYKVPAGGGVPPTAAFAGGSMIGPEGLTISRNGDVYVTDRGGSVYKVASSDGGLTTVVESMRSG